MIPPPSELTAAFVSLASDGKPSDAVLQQIYDALSKIARTEVARLRRGTALDARGLVHEAYCELFGSDARVYANRKHFYVIAAQAMRQVVVDHARQRLTERRGGGTEQAALDALEGQPLLIDEQAEELVHVDAALGRLASFDPRLVQVVELRYFSGLEEVEVADLLGVSEATIKRDTHAARAFLERELAAV